ncbi:MAG: LLM class flavin-dependent oxidoreductase [Rhodospirillales bacterium]|nr:LLM class flavin-dependent oxidoreductase [Rhodospirillales bacterium]
MHFGIFSNGFRPHTSAAETYEEDIREIVLADKLGFRDCYISEHHGEPPYINRVDTSPMPELMMCKAAGLTSQIRMGAAIKLLHLHHPLDVAVQAAAVEHLLGQGRFIFGFGTGFPSPLFCEERGLSFDDRHARLQESLEFILKCWTSDEIFDWDGAHWKGKGVVALPKPLSAPHMPMATATDTESMIKISAERGYIMLSAFLEDAERVRSKSDKYVQYALDAGIAGARQNITTSRVVYIADSYEEALEDMRPAVTYEISVQAERGFLKVLKDLFNVDVPNNEHAIEALVDAGFYYLGEPDRIADQIQDFYDASGGFGTFLIVTGKNWATAEKRARSMTRFMEEVAPKLRHLEPES